MHMDYCTLYIPGKFVWQIRPRNISTEAAASFMHVALDSYEKVSNCFLRQGAS